MMNNNDLNFDKIPFFANKNRFLQILTLLGLILMGMIIFSILGLLVAKLCYGSMPLMDDPRLGGYYRIIQSFGSVGTFLFPALMFAFCTDRKWFNYNKMNRMPNYMMTDIVLIMSLAILPVVMSLAEWNASLHLPDSLAKLDQWMQQLDEQNAQLVTLMCRDPRISVLLVNLLVMGLLPALGEELLFRGTIQTFIHKWTRSPHWAIWITAFIFSAIHFQITGFIPRMLLGAYLGYLMYWSGSLWLPIVAHFMHNSLSVTADYIFMRRGFDVEAMQLSDIHNYQYILGVAIVLTVGGICLLWKFRKKSENCCGCEE